MRRFPSKSRHANPSHQVHCAPEIQPKVVKGRGVKKVRYPRGRLGINNKRTDLTLTDTDAHEFFA